MQEMVVSWKIKFVALTHFSLIPYLVGEAESGLENKNVVAELRVHES